MNLSKNLTLKEVTKSSTAIKYGIDNMPNENQLNALKAIANNVFQPLRDYFKKPLFVSSGFRSISLNTRIGGAVRSQHCKGEALDIDMDGRGGPTNREVFDYIRNNLKFDQLIWEKKKKKGPSWVHVSFSQSGNRGIVLVAYKDNDGRTQYKNYEDD